MQLDTFGCPDALEYSFIEFLGCLSAEVLGPSTTGIYNVHNVMTGSLIYLGLFCQVRWSSNTQHPGEGCTIIAKNNSQIQALDSVYILGACMFYPLSLSWWHTLIYIYCSVYFVFLCQLEVLGCC